MATRIRRHIGELAELPSLWETDTDFDEVRSALRNGEPAEIDGAWGSACALSLAALARHPQSPRAAPRGTALPPVLLAVLPRIADVDDFALDVGNFLGTSPEVFPAWESLPAEYDVADPVFGGRLRILQMLDQLPASTHDAGAPGASATGGRRPSPVSPMIINTSIEALLQPVPAKSERSAATRTIRVGDDLDREEFLDWLVERGFERTGGVEVPGEFSIHGGILDVFPPNAEDPLRIELFGDTVESLRRFNVETQRKVEELTEAALTVVSPQSLRAASESRRSAPQSPRAASRETEQEEHFLDALPPGSWIALAELEAIVDEGKHYLERLKNPRGLFSVDATLEKVAGFGHVTLSGIAPGGAGTTYHLQAESIERFTGPKSAVLEELADVVHADEQVLIACHNEGERQRLSALLAETPTLHERVQLSLGNVSRGFRLLAQGLVVLSDHELFGRIDVRRTSPRKRKIEGRAIDSFLELRTGDLVVHVTHGIGRYRGMKLIKKRRTGSVSDRSSATLKRQESELEEQAEEHLVIEFRDGVLVYVPVPLIHLVQKYVGAARAAPNLSKVGGKSWAKRKQRVSQAVHDMAADMIRLQAAREAQSGIAFPDDSRWQHEFEEAFAYTETDDQLDAISHIKSDMQRHRPMDRLICGDVGYGKTEVAMRAAFKAVEAGRQVAVLVPTTVLAEQHVRTFTDRMAEFPVNIEVLSRFRSAAEQRDILKRLQAGGIDIVIGTHRLVQKDVRFNDLGLLIIDEEQRFGVEAKEMLKRLRLEVDVLTLSATPIPRTLHMSLLGIRDISNLVTPPQDRQSIETRISRFEPELVRRAIIRELNRGGQVYFVHNRVHNIQGIADRVQSIVPEARVGIGHGQMSERRLEAAMYDFVSGKTDVLVCTTIIESGLDIPNANTMFINQAGNFGLADLHQLRGRVGRYKHRAYCYLLLDEQKPVTPKAAKRLKAIEEFRELGAGFKIAMRDLEIRGAGNILGTEQSGHISAVGYELYCRLLENAVRSLKNEPPLEIRHVTIDLPLSAYFPESYIPAGRQKIEMYRKLSVLGSREELADLKTELEDRFGPLPAEAARLLSQRELQLMSADCGIDQIHLEDGYAVFTFDKPKHAKDLKKISPDDLRAVDANTLYLPLADSLQQDALLRHLKTVLQAAS